MEIDLAALAPGGTTTLLAARGETKPTAMVQAALLALTATAELAISNLRLLALPVNLQELGGDPVAVVARVALGLPFLMAAEDRVPLRHRFRQTLVLGPRVLELTAAVMVVAVKWAAATVA